MKMKLSILLTVALAAAGCTGQQPSLDPEMKAVFEQQRTFDIGTITSLQDAAVNNAIFEEPVIYPYHFVPGSDDLTELGQQYVAVLADHYKSSKGQFVIARADTPEALYTRRRDVVMAAMRQAGVAADHVTVAETFTDGGGITGQSIVEARHDKQKAYTSDAGSVSSKSSDKTP
jgi:hypothetical protein